MIPFEYTTRRVEITFEAFHNLERDLWTIRATYVEKPRLEPISFRHDHSDTVTYNPVIRKREEFHFRYRPFDRDDRVCTDLSSIQIGLSQIEGTPIAVLPDRELVYDWYPWKAGLISKFLEPNRLIQVTHTDRIYRSVELYRIKAGQVQLHCEFGPAVREYSGDCVRYRYCCDGHVLTGLDDLHVDRLGVVRDPVDQFMLLDAMMDARHQDR